MRIKFISMLFTSKTTNEEYYQNQRTLSINSPVRDLKENTYLNVNNAGGVRAQYMNMTMLNVKKEKEKTLNSKITNVIKGVKIMIINDFI